MFQRLSRYLAAARLTPQARRIIAARLTYLTPQKLVRLDALSREALRWPGEVFEFGVASGGSAILLAETARKNGRRFVGLDLFATIPPPTSDKDDAKSKQRYEVIRSGQARGIGGGAYYGYKDNLYEEVTASFATHGVPVGDDVQLVKGLFEDTWPTLPPAPIAFAHIDCDWYDPVKFCLERTYERMSAGGVILFDDYHDYGGCRTAVDEFLAAHPHLKLDEGANVAIRVPPY